MQISKLVLPVSILLGCVILGGFYYASVVTQQAASEKQQQSALQAQQQAITASSTERSVTANAQSAVTQAQSDYDTCLTQAQQTYRSSIQADCGGASGCYMSDAQGQANNDALASDKALCEQHYQATLQVVNK